MRVKKHSFYSDYDFYTDTCSDCGCEFVGYWEPGKGTMQRLLCNKCRLPKLPLHIKSQKTLELEKNYSPKPEYVNGKCLQCDCEFLVHVSGDRRFCHVCIQTLNDPW